MGHRVTVLEQSEEIGGKLGVVERDGFVFDTGPALLTMPQVLEELFAFTGASVHDALGLHLLTHASGCRFPDGAELYMPGDLADIPAALDHSRDPGRGAHW